MELLMLILCKDSNGVVKDLNFWNGLFELFCGIKVI